MGHCLAKAMLEVEHHDEYNELASKPGPLTADEQTRLLHHKSRLAAALEAEYFTSPHADKRERFDQQWRAWFGEDPPAPEAAMRGLHEHFARPENRALETVSREVAAGFFDALRKREGVL